MFPTQLTQIIFQIVFSLFAASGCQVVVFFVVGLEPKQLSVLIGPSKKEDREMPRIGGAKNGIKWFIVDSCIGEEFV